MNYLSKNVTFYIRLVSNLNYFAKISILQIRRVVAFEIENTFESNRVYAYCSTQPAVFVHHAGLSKARNEKKKERKERKTPICGDISASLGTRVNWVALRRIVASAGKRIKCRFSSQINRKRIHFYLKRTLNAGRDDTVHCQGTR